MIEHAIYTDCRTIINNFSLNRNPRFESFCVQWKALVFQHIYSAQSSTTELLQTTTTALHVAKRILCQPHNDERQMLECIGALYLMYAIYFKQPTQQYIKVNVTMRDWSKIREFIDKLTLDVDNRAATEEPLYVFWKLYKDNAFCFCAHDFDLGLENLVDYDKVQDRPAGISGNVPMQRIRMLQALEDLTPTTSMLPALATLEDGYNEMKELLVKEKAGDRRALPPTKIFKDIQKVFQNINDIIGDACESDTSDKKQQCNVDSKHDLKRKGYQVTHTKEGLKIDAATVVESPENSRGKRTACRMSAKTVFAEQLPVETLEDLQRDDIPENEQADDIPENEQTDGIPKNEGHNIDLSDQEEFIAN